MNKNIFILFFVILSAIGTKNLYAQDAPPPSIFDEGVDTKINPQDINEDVRQWAFDTALSLEKVLKDIKRLNDPEKRTVLVHAIKDSVTQAQEKRALLLMRFTLNRALKLDEFYSDDALSINYVLIPAVRSAITLYKNSDLPFLEENKDKTEEDTIELPDYARFIKSSLPYLLTVSTMNPSYKHQFSILKLSVVWVTQDLARSKETNRKFNAHIITELEKLYYELEQKCEQDITYTDNNSIRNALLQAKEHIIPEKTPLPSPPQQQSSLAPRSTGRDGKEMIFIPNNKKPSYEKPFYIDETEVTNEEFVEFLNKYIEDGRTNTNEVIQVIRENVNSYDSKSHNITATGSGLPLFVSLYNQNSPANVTWSGAKAYCEYYHQHVPTASQYNSAWRTYNITLQYEWAAFSIDPYPNPADPHTVVTRHGTDIGIPLSLDAQREITFRCAQEIP